jgi:hypothetical protein
MPYRLSEQSDFRLKTINTPIKANIGRVGVYGCMENDADLVAVVPPHPGAKTLPFGRDVQMHKLAEVLRLRKL